MTFSYNFNTGKVPPLYNGYNGGYDATYLREEMGFSDDATSTDLFFTNVGKLDTEYEAKFGTTLAISDNYKFFEAATGEMDSFTLSNEIAYTSITAKSRTDVYKEMFLEKFKPGSDIADTKLTVTGHDTAFNTGAYDYVMYQSDATTGALLKNTNGEYIPVEGAGGTALLSALPATNNKAQLMSLYLQLASETTKLKAGLNTSELAYGGYPTIGYKSVDAEIALLNQQLESATQNFVKIYDDLFMHYKIKAGATSDDDSGNDAANNQVREQEAATAATMAATLAMNYAQKYHSQSIKPKASDYVFGQAPLIFTEQTFVTRYKTVEGEIVNEASGVPIHTGSYIYTLAVGNALTISANGSTTLEYQDPDTNEWSTTEPAQVDCSTQIGQNNLFSTLLDPYSKKNAADLKNMLLESQTSGYAVINRTTANVDASYMTNMSDSTAITELGTTDLGSKIPITTDFTADMAIAELGGTRQRYIDWMVRDSFGVGGLTPTIKNTTYCADSATFLAKDIVAAAEALVALKMKIQTKTIESSINNKSLAEYESRVGAMAAIQQLLANCTTGTDPYELNIDGQDYIMGQDKNNDGTINNLTEILGIKDTQENLFASLKNLDDNKDGYVSQEEIKAHNIVLNAVDNESGQLKNVGYDMSLVKGISLADLQQTDGTNNVFGKFTMDLQDRKINGNLTFEENSYFNKLFGSNVDFSILSQYESIDDESSSDAIALTPSYGTPSKTAQPAEEVKAEPPVLESVAPEPKTFSLFDAKNFSFDFFTAEDNKSAFENLLDQLSWQMNINTLTSTQKYNILDGIDANQDVDLAKVEIQQELEKLNLSA